MYDSPRNNEERDEVVEQLLAIATKNALWDSSTPPSQKPYNDYNKNNFDNIDRAQISLYKDLKPIINQNSVNESLRESLTKDQLQKYEL